MKVPKGGVKRLPRPQVIIDDEHHRRGRRPPGASPRSEHQKRDRRLYSRLKEAAGCPIPGMSPNAMHRPLPLPGGRPHPEGMFLNRLLRGVAMATAVVIMTSCG